ncbi:MAG: AsmA family protein, partial [Betaproteobacteria bacterium]|nr:AsmA family protein [Betaproteobacteria bacterium]
SMSLRRFLGIVLAIAAALLLAAVLYLAFGNLSRHKGRIESLVTESIGRPFAIDGPFELEVLPAIYVRAERVRVGNIPGGSAPQMVEIGHFSARVGLWSLVSGPVDVRSFELRDVAVVLEKDADGKGNWLFGDDVEALEHEDALAAQATEVPAVILQAKLDNLRVAYREPGKPERVALLETFTIASAADGLFALAGKGRLDEYPATLTGDVGPLAALVSGRDMRVALQASLGNLRLDLKGVLGRLDPLDGADLALKIEHPDFGAMPKNLQLPVFAAGALALDARLQDAGDLTRLEVDAKLDGISARVNGTLAGLGLPGSDLQFEASVADAARVAAAFGVTGLPAGAAKARGRIVSSRTEIKLDGVGAQYAGAKATADGTIRTSGVPGAAVRFRLAAESLAKLAEGLPAIPLQASGNYTGSRARLEVKDLKGRVGNSDFSARASMSRSGTRRVEADVASPVLDLTPFLPVEAKTKAKPAPKAAEKKFVFGEEPLPLGELKALDAKLHVAIGELKLGAGSLKDVDGTLARPRIAVSATGAAAAAATGGMTVLAQGLWDRLRGAQDLCKPTLDAAAK